MFRIAVCAGLFLVLAGCAGGSRTRAPEERSRLDELASSQARLELRIDEVTRNLLALRERLDAQEAAFQELKAAREETTVPSLRVVKLEPEPLPTQARAAPPGDGRAPAAQLYRRAFNAYREGRYGEAILDFEEFLRSYADHEYADNAQYWIAESYYSQGEYEQAVVEFNRVLDQYPHEAKAPDALLKIGHSYEKLGDPERARVFWSRLVSQYPLSEAARQAQKLLSAEP